MPGGERLINVNVGILGHVDAGKTTLARFLSTTASTACFDKSPQSISRGITLDLGFSSFQRGPLQVTLVDCPGHASLFRTVIGAAAIMDAVILVVDGRVGIQVQTAECLLLAELVTERLLVVISKVDLTTDAGQAMEHTVLKTVRQATKFKKGSSKCKSASVRYSAMFPDSREAVLDALETLLYPLSQRDSSGSALIAVDHCFALRQGGGRGCTVMTGTILQGSIQVGDVLETPSLGPLMPVTIKSIQSFHQSISSAAQGDRVGLNVGLLSGINKKIERTVLATRGSLPPTRLFIIPVSRIRHYKGPLVSGGKYHLSVLHDTAIATATFVRSTGAATEYEYLSCVDPGADADGDDVFAFLHLAGDALIYPQIGCLAVLSRLDLDSSRRVCRLAFYGKVVTIIPLKDDMQARIFKWKRRIGRVERIVDATRLVGKDLCPTLVGLQKLIGHGCRIVSDDGSNPDATLAHGIVESTFGTSGKFKVILSSSLPSPDAATRLKICIHSKQYMSLHS